MSAATERLVFYNGEGYPHNFRLTDGIWNGKIFYEPNSANLFKTISMYVLEEVPSIKYDGLFDMVNTEIYNDLGMSIFSHTNDNTSVERIKAVNESPNFYSKWIYGKRLNKLYPTGTVISFVGYVQNLPNGESDFLMSKYFNVLRTKKDAIMIATDTPNSDFSWEYDQSVNNLKINSYNCLSIPDFKRDIPTIFNPDNDMKISIVGSENNDTVIEINNKTTTKTRMFDFDLYDLNQDDMLSLELELLTERPLLYNGNINLTKEGSTLKIDFLNGRNSNFGVGAEFIIEDQDGNHLLNSNEYKIEEILKETYLSTETITFTTNSYVDDDSTVINEYFVTYPKTVDVKLNDRVRFKNANTSDTNDNLIRRITSLTENDYTFTAKLDGVVYAEADVSFDLYKVFKDYQQNLAVISSSIDFSTFPNLEPVRCYATSNKIKYDQVINANGIQSSLDTFVDNYSAYFRTNGVDLYRMDNTLFVEGMYGGQSPYFNATMYVTNGGVSTIRSLKGDYSDVDGNTTFYNFVLKSGELVNERQNMTNLLSTSYNATIGFELSDDIQDYGFQIELNNIQYYIEFIDDPASTTQTHQTILAFIAKYEDVFNKAGFNLVATHTVNDTQLIISGQEPNVDVYSLVVKVNKNSSYTLEEIENNRMIVTSNYIETNLLDLINYGYSTSMTLNINGSSIPSNNQLYNIVGIHPYRIELSYQGAFYSESDVYLSLSSNEFMRKPRESSDMDIYYRFRWDDDRDESIFLYDISGENLKPWGENPKFAYTGVKPLNVNNDEVFLNDEPNKIRDFVSIPSKQQTIFKELEFLLDEFDEDNLELLPEPIQVFIGYNSTLEGVNDRTLIMERIDNVSYSGYADGVDLYFTFVGNTMTITATNGVNLLNMGFKTNRDITIKFDDNKPYTQMLFENYQDYRIIDVTKKKIVIEGEFVEFSTQDEEFDFEIIQLPEQIGEFILYGQTEIEDERLKANMRLIGVNLSEEDEYIFEESNIKEKSNDYTLLNRKREEMMSVYKDIYDYIGSYRAIFNAINFFGYEDIQLVEYYRNIDENSPLFDKLKRIVIPDLLDRSVEGWSYSEDMAKRIGYKKTNLFNLTYRITDEEGNNVNIYSLEEVQYKLNGLKEWLRKNILPVNTNITDITGVAECVDTIWTRYDPSVNMIDHKTIESTTAVNFSYIATRNFNNSWIISIRFYTVNGYIPEAFDLKVKTYVVEEDGVLRPQQVYDIMKTDLEPFNFNINWEEDLYDLYFKIETIYYDSNGLGLIVDKMYKLEDMTHYYYDEKKNYTLVEHNFDYKYDSYVQNDDTLFVFDEHGNTYEIDKNQVDNVIEREPVSYNNRDVEGDYISLISPYRTRDYEYKGQIHFHTNNGNDDGGLTPLAVVTRYRDAGYDFVAPSAHDDYTPDPNVENILYIQNIEENVSEAHIGVLNSVTKQSSYVGQDVIDNSRAAGAICTINHPKAPYKTINLDGLLELQNWNNLEIYNARQASHGFEPNSEDLWDGVLSTGRKVNGVATDDYHDDSSGAFAYTSIQVFADELTVESITDSVLKGNFYSSFEGVDMTIRVIYNTVKITTSASSKIEFIGINGSDLRTVSGTTEAEYTCVGDELYIRAKVTRGTGMAWSNPIYVYKR